MEYGAVNDLSQTEVNPMLQNHKIAVIRGNGHTRSVSDRFMPEITAQAMKVSTYCCKDKSLMTINTLEEAIFKDSAEIILGVGGGKVMDVSKVVGTRLQMPVILIPTTVSTDAICSPVAAVRTNQHTRNSMRVNMPWAVVIDFDILASSPPRFLSAGIGELLSNITALFDWNLAYRLNKEKMNLVAKLIAKNAVESVIGSIHHEGLLQTSMLKTVTESLIMSGIAMSVAGNSRPCSGSEHLISHALDYYCGAKALHGEQVAICSLIAEYMQGQNDPATSLRQYFPRFGLPTHYNELGYTREDMRVAIQKAPAIRNRFTILNEYDLSNDKIDEILDRVFPS
jgi:glycerol-1-phosphate dehydrogenase [NAD(P)+]